MLVRLQLGLSVAHYTDDVLCCDKILPLAVIQSLWYRECSHQQLVS